jgi:hypothetical protein
MAVAAAAADNSAAGVRSAAVDGIGAAGDFLNANMPMRMVAVAAAAAAVAVMKMAMTMMKAEPIEAM